ncbi:hypothetical protein HZA39_00575 [Candidatus Peregrinibacteria bacterium]|nr:hypothetical protein [Candidatus Peregrinibacteria bacterium]
MNKIKKIIICLPMILVLFGLLAPIALAQVKIPSEYIKDIGTVPMKELVQTKDTGTDSKPAGTSSINYLLQKVADGLIYIAAPLAVLFIVHAGVSYAMSTGDNTKIEAAKKEIIWAVLGLVIILIAFVIIRMFLGFFFSVDDTAQPTPQTNVIEQSGGQEVPQSDFNPNTG